MGKTVIIGAGLAGLSAGYHAELSGIDYAVYEAENTVGGLCRTLQQDGFRFDFSGHLLHLKDPYFQSLVGDLLGDNRNVIGRNAAIYSQGVFTRYPFQANLYGLPPEVVKECLLEFVKAYYGNEDLPTRTFKTFEEWIVAKLGAGIGRHFMFPYNEKIWTVPTGEMTCDWMSVYVPKPSLEDVFNGAFEDQGKRFGYNASFWYPKRGGIQALCDALAARVPCIHRKKEVVAIDPAGKIVTLSSGSQVAYDRLISTMPLHRLAAMLSRHLPDAVNRAATNLRHNSVLIVNLGVGGAKRTDRHWVYLPEKKFAAYRVGSYSNFSDALAPEGTSSFYIEIGYRKEWNIDKRAIVDRAVSQMADLGFIDGPGDVLVKDVRDIECAYVIYDRNHSDSRRVLLDHLASLEIASIGRYGNWEYSGMEEALTQGKRLIDIEVRP
ncbi:MAG: FAD-dependent oxidoreductase [Candidatus Deferrimicrobium sp.]